MYLRIFMDRIFSKFTQYFPIVQVRQALRAGPDYLSEESEVLEESELSEVSGESGMRKIEKFTEP